MNAYLTKFVAGAALAALIVPAAASAHGLGLNLGEGLKLGVDHAVNVKADANASANASFHREGGKHAEDSEHDGDEGKVKAAATTTTAASITKRANRLELTADLLGSMSGTLSTKIAGVASSSQKTVLQTTLGTFNTSVAGAKTNAQAALNVAGQIGSSTASSTLVAQANADLSAARGFITDAMKALHSIFHALLK